MKKIFCLIYNTYKDIYDRDNMMKQFFVSSFFQRLYNVKMTSSKYLLNKIGKLLFKRINWDIFKFNAVKTIVLCDTFVNWVALFYIFTHKGVRHVKIYTVTEVWYFIYGAFKCMTHWIEQTCEWIVMIFRIFYVLWEFESVEFEGFQKLEFDSLWSN